jgi:hypothetical protein
VSAYRLEGRPTALAVRLLLGMYVFAVVGQVAPLFGAYAYYAGFFLRISGVALFVLLSVANWSWQTWLSNSFFSVIVSIVVSSAFARHLAGPRCRPLSLAFNPLDC